MILHNALVRRASRLGRRLRLALLAACLATVCAAGAAAQAAGAGAPQEGAAPQTLPAAGQHVSRNDAPEPWREALVALPLAALLGAVLAFRPVRRGTPPREPAVIQTQIVLAVIGAVIMLVVGASLARAFGIVGAASLVRYRAKISDPKDAAVMLAALGVGLATGVGIYLVATIATVFLLALLWGLESFEPTPRRDFELTIKGDGVGSMQSEIERVLRESRIRFDLRTVSQDEFAYAVQIPARRRTERLAETIRALDPDGAVTVELAEGKKK
jgi:hypothetical protein